MLHHRERNLQRVQDLVHPAAAAAALHHSWRRHLPPSAHTTHGDGGEGEGGGRGGGRGSFHHLAASAGLVLLLPARKRLVALLVPHESLLSGAVQRLQGEASSLRRLAAVCDAAGC